MRNTHVRHFKSFVSRGVSAAVLGGFISLGSAQAQNFDAVQIKTSDLGSHIYMLEGAGGNLVASFGEDGIFLIDDQYAPLTEKILAALQKIGSGEVKYVINTHWHFDHTGGNENLGKKGSVIVAHRNVRKRMSVDQVMNVFDMTVPASPDIALPVVTFDGNVDFYFNDHKIEVKSVEAAHTDGDSIVFIKDANVLHMGDTFWNKLFPLIDAESGGRIAGVIAVQEIGLALADDDTKIIPGHGGLATKADLQETRDGLVSIQNALQSGIDKGMSDEEIIADKPLDGLDLDWGGSFTHDKFVAIVLAGMR